MKIQQLMKNGNEIIWSTENLVLFGTWLINKGDYGYGFLCIHGSCLGLKIGTLLKLKWNDFINFELFNDGNIDCCYSELIIEDSKKNSKQILHLSWFTRYSTEKFFTNNHEEYNLETDSNIYINTKTKKVLSTTSLNRELNKLYNEFEEYILKNTFLKLQLRPLKSNTMEIAWARDFVTKYNCTKKAFIIVSKHMGHRTVNDTINLLEIEPNDEIMISYDLFNPSPKAESEFEEIFLNKEKFKHYLLNQQIVTITSEFIRNRDKSKDYDIRDKST